jgi:hypothetical protein
MEYFLKVMLMLFIMPKKSKNPAIHQQQQQLLFSIFIFGLARKPHKMKPV